MNRQPFPLYDRPCVGFGVAALAAVLMPIVCGGPAWGLINPNFTPADLVRDSSRILALKVSAPQGGRLGAEVVRTLKGDTPAKTELTLDISDAEEVTEKELHEVFGNRTALTAMLFVSKSRRDPPGETPTALLQLDTTWFAAFAEPGRWRLDADRQALLTVWAGSARMLEAATQYVLTDPAADFPVRSSLRWASDLRLGTLSGSANGCLVVDFGPPLGLCAVVLSDGGDRVYRAASDDKRPADVTARVRLNTASKIAVPGDFNGDERIDLACWDGKSLVLALQGATGALTTRHVQVGLPACRSLDVLDLGAEAGAGLLVGTSEGPLLLAPGSDGNFTSRDLSDTAQQKAMETFGRGGLCRAADFDGDGHCDVVQLFSGGMVYYAGQGAGQFGTPVTAKTSLANNLHAAVCGDYDADALLDLIVAGDDGFAFLSRGADRRWQNRTCVTGELDCHGKANRPRIAGVAPCDINNDGRQSVAFFYPRENPMVFFNRGFACFGLARELLPSGAGAMPDDPLDPFAGPRQAKLKAAEALQFGQAAGTMLDLSGDSAQDLLAVDPKGQVWALFGEAEEDVLALTLHLTSAAKGPLTLSVSHFERHSGMYVLKPGTPAFIGCREPGPVLLQWVGPDGTRRTREVIVEESVRVEIDP